MIIQEDEEKFLNTPDEDDETTNVKLTLTYGELEAIVGIVGEYLDENYDKSMQKVYDKLLLYY